MTDKNISLGESKKTTRGLVFRCGKKDGEDWPVAIFSSYIVTLVCILLG